MRSVLFLLFILTTGANCYCQQEWSLQKCIDKAFENNIQIKQSELGLGLAHADRKQALGAALPSVNASASHGYNFGQAIDPFTNTFATSQIRSNSFGANTNVILFSGLQTYNSIKQSEVNVEARKADIEAMQNDVVLNVSSAYLGVLFNQEFVNIAQSTVSATQQQVDRVQKLVDAGQLPAGNLSDIQAQLASEQATLIGSQNNLDLAYLSLSQLLFLTEEESRSLNVQSPSPAQLEETNLAPNAEGAVSNALGNFPQMTSARLGVESAELGLSIAKGSMSPRLTASYSYGTGYSGANMIGVGTPSFIDIPIGIDPDTGNLILETQEIYTDFQTKPFGDQLSENTNSSLFFSLNIPIFNGWFTSTNIQRAEIGLKNAMYNQENAELLLEQDVRRAYADALASQKNFDAAEIAYNASVTAHDYAKVRFEEGVINFVDYNSAKVRMDNSQAEMLRNKYDSLFKVKIIEFYQGKILTLR